MAEALGKEGEPGNAGPPQPGQILSTVDQDRLKLTPEQKKKLAELQKETDDQLDTLLKDDQKKQFKQMLDFAKGIGGPPGGQLVNMDRDRDG